MTIMAALSPKARALVQAGQDAYRPTDADRTRIEAALAAHLGPGALPTDAPPAPVPGGLPATAGWHSLARVVMGVGLAGGLGFFALRPGANHPVSPPDHPSPPPALASAAPAAMEPSAAPAPEVAPAEPGTTAESDAPVSKSPRSRDSLAQEVLLLSRAASDLRAGRPAEALKALDEHQRKFPRGTLSVERRAGKAQALCALKRVSEGRAELAHLAAGSPAAARAAQVCDSNARVSP